MSFSWKAKSQLLTKHKHLLCTYIVSIPYPHGLVKGWCCQPCWVWTKPHICNQCTVLFKWMLQLQRVHIPQNSLLYHMQYSSQYIRLNDTKITTRQVMEMSPNRNQIDNSQLTDQHRSITFLSWPALANIFPSEEKWQQNTLLVLARRQPTSLKEKPVKMHPMLYNIVRLCTERTINYASFQISSSDTWLEEMKRKILQT